MTKTLTLLAAGTAVALLSIAAPTTADARCRGCGVAAGVIGGIAAGAAIAGATSDRYYGPGYAYDSGYAPAYDAYDGPVYNRGYDDGYRYRGRYYGGSTADYTNQDRMMQGTR